MSNESDRLYRTYLPDEIAAAEALVILSRSRQSAGLATHGSHSPHSVHSTTHSTTHSAHSTHSAYSTYSPHTSDDDMSTDEQPILVDTRRTTRRRRRSTNPPPPENPHVPSSNRKTGSKPRWRLEERRALFAAVIRHKDLENMQSYDWEEISRMAFNGSRRAKACKDQWRREILPKFIAGE